MFKSLLLRNWVAQNDGRCGIFYKCKNLERKKCKAWLKCYFDMTSTYMESWDLLPKTITGVSPSYWQLQGCAQRTKKHQGPPVRGPLYFPKWEDLNWSSWEKQGFGWGLQGCCRSCPAFTVPALRCWGGGTFQAQRIFKVGVGRGEEKGWDSSVWRGKAEGYDQVVQNHSGVAWDGCRIHSSNPTIMGQGGLLWN